jgi:hypothetical protein
VAGPSRSRNGSPGAYIPLKPVAVCRAGRKNHRRDKLSGDFPGSPITLDFVLQFKDGKISLLEIPS